MKGRCCLACCRVSTLFYQSMGGHLSALCDKCFAILDLGLKFVLSSEGIPTTHSCNWILPNKKTISNDPNEIMIENTVERETSCHRNANLFIIEEQ